MSLPAPRPEGTALITGASSGIGSSIARQLARRRLNVTLVARREERLRELAAELVDEHGVDAGIITADLGTREGRDEVSRKLKRQALAVDLLVNNAGFGYAGDFASAERERQVEMVALNCEAIVDLTSRFLAAMVGRGAGGVINIASTAAFQPMPKGATYAATKAFVLSFSEALHSEVAGSGVSVTAVCPGPVKTEFMDASGIKGEEKLPRLFWHSPDDIAEEALRAAEAGKRAVTPGLVNRAGSVLGRYTPRTVSLPITKRFWGQATE